MRISLDWLRQYVEVPVPAKELGERLTMAGFPVPSIEDVEGDAALEVEVTSNRPDLQCHIGIAREVAAFLGKSVRMPQVKLPAASPDTIPVDAAAPDLCP